MSQIDYQTYNQIDYQTNTHYEAFFDNTLKQLHIHSFNLDNIKLDLVKDELSNSYYLWDYISERSYGNFYKAIIYSAHKLDILKYINLDSIMSGELEESYKEALYKLWIKTQL
jgi:hypothetical protein